MPKFVVRRVAMWAAGLLAVSQGLSRVHAEDAAMLEHALGRLKLDLSAFFGDRRKFEVDVFFALNLRESFA